MFASTGEVRTPLVRARIKSSPRSNPTDSFHVSLVLKATIICKLDQFFRENDGYRLLEFNTPDGFRAVFHERTKAFLVSHKF